MRRALAIFALVTASTIPGVPVLADEGVGVSR